VGQQETPGETEEAKTAAGSGRLTAARSPVDRAAPPLSLEASWLVYRRHSSFSGSLLVRRTFACPLSAGSPRRHEFTLTQGGSTQPPVCPPPDRRNDRTEAALRLRRGVGLRPPATGPLGRKSGTEEGPRHAPGEPPLTRVRPRGVGKRPAGPSSLAAYQTRRANLSFGLRRQSAARHRTTIWTSYLGTLRRRSSPPHSGPAGKGACHEVLATRNPPALLPFEGRLLLR
jgi:hypothetical protein